MNPYLSMKRLTLLFFGLFAILVAVALVYQRVWADPGERCEASGNWYDISTRTCATPVYLPDITGRPAGVTRAEASAAKNRELIALEAQAAGQARALDAAVDKGRADLDARETP